jgi:biopolymer transport protein ExbD
MNMRPNRREQLDVNIAPLIDVVFLLLIFFMVTTTFDKFSTIVINLPEATKNPREVKLEPIELAIDSSGRYYVANKLLINTQLDTLRRALSEAAGGQKNLPLLINADGLAPHQSVVTALDAARQEGMINISIATRDRGKN